MKITYNGASVEFEKASDKQAAFDALRELIDLLGEQRSTLPNAYATSKGPIETEYLKLSGFKFMKLSRQDRETGLDREQAAQARIDLLGQSDNGAPTETCDAPIDLDYVTE